MSLEAWKEALDWVAVLLVGLTFVAGAGALIVGKVLNTRQATQLLQFQKDLTDSQTRLAEAQTKLTEVQLALKNAAERAATSRRIIVGNRNGDQEIRDAKFKALEPYAGTPTTIIFVQDEEAEILAFDIKNALSTRAGWKSISIIDRARAQLPLGLIEEGVQVRTLQRVNGNVIRAAPVPGTKPPAFAEALINLLNLDLGPPVGSPVGVRWEPDAIINGKPLGVLISYGLQIPDNGVVITVGRKPTQELFWGIPDLQLPQKK